MTKKLRVFTLDGKRITIRRPGIGRVFGLIIARVEYLKTFEVLNSFLEEKKEIEYFKQALSEFKTKQDKLRKEMRFFVKKSAIKRNFIEVLNLIMRVNSQKEEPIEKMEKELEEKIKLKAESVVLFRRICELSLSCYYQVKTQADRKYLREIYFHFLKKLNDLMEMEKKAGRKEKKKEINIKEIKDSLDKMQAELVFITGYPEERILKMDYQKAESLIRGYNLMRLKNISDIRAAVWADRKEMMEYREKLYGV